MWRHLALVSAFLLLPACASLPRVVGGAAPDFYLNDQNGAVWSSQNLKDGLLLVDFWASWCEPCIASIPTMNALHDSAKGRFNFISLAVEDSGWDQVRPLIASKGIQYPVAIAPKNLAKAYDVEVLPTLFIIQDGKVLKALIGSHDLAELQAQIRPYLPKDQTP